MQGNPFEGNPFDGRLPPEWRAECVSGAEPNVWVIKNQLGQVVLTTKVDRAFPAHSTIRSCWIRHLIPAVGENPGNLLLREAGFSKYWRLPL